MGSLQLIETQIMGLETPFNKIAGTSLNVKFAQESQFALQLLKANDYKGNNFLRTTAQNNPESLQASIINIAAVDLSLNPVSKDAYLVPRDGRVCLDVSYRGLCKLGERAGSVRLVQSKIVRKNDDFQLTGATTEPIHSYSPFKERGEIVGVFCIAVLQTGEVLTEVMTLEECYYIRDRTQIWQKSQKGPWKDFPEEMIKKTVIKRASKTWPTVGASNHLQKAIEVINEHEGINFEENRAREEKEGLEEANKAREEYKENQKKRDAKIKLMVDEIMKLCGDICKNRSNEEKITLINDIIKINNFNELPKKSPENLKIIIDDLKAFKWPGREMTEQEKEFKKMREGL